ncbi:MAG TPA: serine/threonine-protein kinase [Polyangium sp.]|nr:serine/threonine-protein kinase [Polyangium sp.]
MSDFNANAPVIRAGDIIGGKYRVERVIGQGGMGTVVRARHTLLEQDVAIKVLAAELAADPQYVQRFLREAQASVTIKSEHVARVIDVGTRENGAPFMVMEYLDGRDLGAIVEASGPLQVSDAVDYVLQACEALVEAHAAGLTHRDIKPSNLFLAKRSDGSPLVKLLDFGIAKPASATDSRLTATGMAMGSPSYMSPEQVRNAKTVDQRSDIWSLGASLHEMLAGTPPFRAETFPSLCAAIIADDPIPIRDIRQDLPPEFQAVIGKCLEKKPEQRYQNVGELAMALAPFGGPNAQISVGRITKIINPSIMLPLPPPQRVSITSMPGVNASPFAATAASAAVSVSQAPPQKRRSPAIFVAAGLFIVFAGAGIFMTVRDKEPRKRGHAGTEAPADPATTKAGNSPVVAPAGTPATPTGVTPATSATTEANGAPLVPTALTNPLSSVVRPLGTTKPASTKSTKKNPNYDPFADQH